MSNLNFFKYKDLKNDMENMYEHITRGTYLTIEDKKKSIANMLSNHFINTENYQIKFDEVVCLEGEDDKIVLPPPVRTLIRKKYVINSPIDSKLLRYLTNKVNEEQSLTSIYSSLTFTNNQLEMMIPYQQPAKNIVNEDENYRLADNILKDRIIPFFNKQLEELVDIYAEWKKKIENI